MRAPMRSLHGISRPLRFIAGTCRGTCMGSIVSRNSACPLDGDNLKSQPVSAAVPGDVRKQ
jgi:hypothetical protein